LWAAIGGASSARKMYPSLRRHPFVTFALSAVVLVTVGSAFLHSRYMHFNAPTFHKRGLLRSITANTWDHTAEWGEMTVNAPLSKLPNACAWPVRIVGAFAILACIWGIWTKRKRPDSLAFYVLGYACIVFAYPWFDTRLWLAIVPFLMGYVLLGLRRMVSPRTLPWALVVYCTLFCALGILALGFSTRLTFAGARFPDIYGDGHYRSAYKVALEGEPSAPDADVDQDAVYLLRRFEWRAAGE
jgi:hypothetical protein